MEQVRKYRRMTWDDRLRIEALYNANHTFRFIAERLGFSISSVYTEVQHGLYQHMGAELTKRPCRYSAQLGQEYADAQATSKGVPIKLGHNYEYAKAVAAAVKQGRSPDDFVGSLRRDGKWTVSTPTLYRYIDRGYIPGVTNKNLLEKPKRKRKNNHVHFAARPPKGLSIERRPAEIDTRSTFGHWEMDSVIGRVKGKRESFLVLTERKTRFEMIFRVFTKTSASTVRALERALSKFPQGTFRTITVDNGSEFQDCYGMEHDRNDNKRVTVYYCHPFTSCERGSNERTNRIIRRFFPKGKSLKSYTQKDCDRAAGFINSMHRRILNYSTAEELFQQELEQLQNPA